MGDENELNTSAGAFSSRLSSRSFDMPGGALSSVARGLFSSLLVPLPVVPWFLVQLLPCPALLASCLSCGRPSCVSDWFACYPFRSIVVSFGSPLVRQVVRGDSVLRFCLGSPRSLLPVACRGGAVDVAGAVPLVGLARCHRVDGVCRRRDFRRSRCLPWAFLSVWCVSLVPVVCFAPRCRRVLSWADRRRVLSSWLRLVVGRRGSSPFSPCLPSGVVVIRVRPVGHPPLIVSLIVFDRLVDRFAARLVARSLVPSCLSCGGAANEAGSFSSRAACLCG